MARLLDTKVKFYDELNYQAAGKSYGAWGSFLPMLDAVLVEGFGAFIVEEVLFKEDTSEPEKYWFCGVKTAPLVVARGKMTIIEIKGSTYGWLNKEHRVQEIDGQGRCWFCVPKSVSESQPSDLRGVSGAVVSYPALGWEKQWEKQGARVYRIKDPKHRNFYLRFQDTDSDFNSYLRLAYASMYTQMNNIDDIDYRPERLKAPYRPENPLQPERNPDSDYYFGGFPYNTKYGANNKLSTHVNYLTDRDPWMDNFNIIGDDRTFFFSIGNENSESTALMNTTVGFGAYAPSDGSSSSFPYFVSGVGRTTIGKSVDGTWQNALSVNATRNSGFGIMMLSDYAFPWRSSQVDLRHASYDTIVRSFHTFNEKTEQTVTPSDVLRPFSAGASPSEVEVLSSPTQRGYLNIITPLPVYAAKMRYDWIARDQYIIDGKMRLIRHQREDTPRKMETYVAENDRSYLLLKSYIQAGRNQTHLLFDLADPKD